MRNSALLPTSVILIFGTLTSTGHSITGGGTPNDALARSVVTIIGSRGTVCTGSLIAPNIVLTAGHCIALGTSYRVIDPSTQPPKLITAQKAFSHPQFSMQTMLAHRATADVALLLLPSPVPDKVPVKLGMPRTPIQSGARLTVAGVGVTRSGGDEGVGTVRTASLSVTGQPGTLQIRLVDRATGNVRSGLGACTGDSGAPVFEDQNGASIVVGVVSWSTGPNNSDGCGGLTGVTPLTLYRDWIVKTARDWGAAL